jgi:hypothetical protein
LIFSGAESMIAPFLTELAARYKTHGIKVGSYPSSRKHVIVSLIGVNEGLVKEVAKEVCLPF